MNYHGLAVKVKNLKQGIMFLRCIQAHIWFTGVKPALTAFSPHREGLNNYLF